MIYFEDIREGDEIPQIVKKPTLKQLVKFAGAALDFTEIHYDYEAARKAGLDGVICHGMLTTSFIVQAITDFVSYPWQLKWIKVRFKAPAKPGETITCGGKVISKEECENERGDRNRRGKIRLSVWARNQNGVEVASGEALVELPLRVKK